MTKIIEPTETHEKCKLAMLEAMRPYVDELSQMEVLAIMAQVVGQLIALQDQTKYSSDAIMKMVAANIEHGNQMVVNDLLAQTAGNA